MAFPSRRRPLMAGTGESSATVLDPGVLDALERDLGDREFVREVVQLYLDQLVQRRQAVAAAVAADDLGAVQREAHALGSASAMVGAVELRDLCRKLELTDPADGPLGANPVIAPWSQACSDIAAALTTWLADS